MFNKGQIKKKIHRVFQALLEGKSINRFEAEVQLYDHCLPSTISSIQEKYNVEVCRKYESVSGYRGRPVRCCRYRISPEEIERYIKNISIKKAPASDQTEGDLQK